MIFVVYCVYHSKTPLSPYEQVLLCLGQQVARDLDQEVDLGRIQLRLMWIEYVAMLLDPRDPDVAPHIAAVLIEIIRALKAYTLVGTNEDCKRKAELLSMAVSSLHSRCDRQ